MVATGMDERIVVVGGSLAAARALQALRREGHTGPITVIGAEDHWPPYDRPPLSKQVLVGALDPERVRLRLPDDAELTVLTGRRATGLALDRSAVEVDDGSNVEYDKLVIATGGVPRLLPGADDLAGTHVLRTLDDSLGLARALHDARQVAVVGAGFIGCEVASACRTMGVEVTMIDAVSFPLAPLGPVVGDHLSTVLRDNGVDLHLGVAVAGLVGNDQVEGVLLADGTAVAADLVVVGIGMAPATDWLRSSGLTLDDGVVCDATCLAVGGGRKVAAAGDVARWDHPRVGSIRLEHWANATEQASHAVRALVHGPEVAGPFAPVPYFWTDQFGLKLQVVGFCDPNDSVEVIEGSLSDNRFVAAYVRGGAVNGVLCVNMPRRLTFWQARLNSPDPVPISECY